MAEPTLCMEPDNTQTPGTSSGLLEERHVMHANSASTEWILAPLSAGTGLSSESGGLGSSPSSATSFLGRFFLVSEPLWE